MRKTGFPKNIQKDVSIMFSYSNIGHINYFWKRNPNSTPFLGSFPESNTQWGTRWQLQEEQKTRLCISIYNICLLACSNSYLDVQPHLGSSTDMASSCPQSGVPQLSLSQSESRALKQEWNERFIRVSCGRSLHSSYLQCRPTHRMKFSRNRWA